MSPKKKGSAKKGSSTKKGKPTQGSPKSPAAQPAKKKVKGNGARGQHFIKARRLALKDKFKGLTPLQDSWREKHIEPGSSAWRPGEVRMRTHRIVALVPQPLVPTTSCYEDVKMLSFREEKDGLVLAEVEVLHRTKNRKIVVPSTFVRVFNTLRTAAPHSGSTPARVATGQRQLNYSDSSSDESD